MRSDYDRAYGLLGSALFSKEDYAGALAAFRKAVNVNPKLDGCYAGIGDVLRSEGDLEGALAAYSNAADLNPKSSYYAAIGDVLRLAHDFDGALVAYRKATERSRENFYAFRQLGNALVGKGDLGGAAIAYRRVVELRPNDVYMWYCLADAHLGAGQRDAYCRVCAEMFKRLANTKDPAAADRAVYACVTTPDALDDMTQLLPLAELAATLKGNARVLGAALYRAGKYEAAIGPLKQGQSRAWDHLFLAMAHHRLGHADKAREYLERARSQIKSADYPWFEAVESECLYREAEALIKMADKKEAEAKK